MKIAMMTVMMVCGLTVMAEWTIETYGPYGVEREFCKGLPVEFVALGCQAGWNGSDVYQLDRTGLDCLDVEWNGHMSSSSITCGARWATGLPDGQGVIVSVDKGVAEKTAWFLKVLYKKRVGEDLVTIFWNGRRVGGFGVQGTYKRAATSCDGPEELTVNLLDDPRLQPTLSWVLAAPSGARHPLIGNQPTFRPDESGTWRVSCVGNGSVSGRRQTTFEVYGDDRPVTMRLPLAPTCRAEGSVAIDWPGIGQLETLRSRTGQEIQVRCARRSGTRRNVWTYGLWYRDPPNLAWEQVGMTSFHGACDRILVSYRPRNDVASIQCFVSTAYLSGDAGYPDDFEISRYREKIWTFDMENLVRRLSTYEAIMEVPIEDCDLLVRGQRLSTVDGDPKLGPKTQAMFEEQWATLLDVPDNGDIDGPTVTDAATMYWCDEQFVFAMDRMCEIDPQQVTSMAALEDAFAWAAAFVEAESRPMNFEDCTEVVLNELKAAMEALR